MNKEYIKSAHDQHLIATLHPSSGGKLLVLFPGVGYLCDSPLLYYPRLIGMNNGYDVLTFTHSFVFSKLFWEISGDEQDQWYDEEMLKVSNHLIDLEKNYERIVYLGKSMGTTSIKKLIEWGHCNPRYAYIIMTPGTTWADQIDLYNRINNRILVIGSRADRYFTIEKFDHTKFNDNVEFFFVDNADHLLEKGTYSETRVVLDQVMNKIEKFLQ
jgi:phosphoglycolate phosphatase